VELRASAAALASCGRYCFVSSISAYASFAHAPVRESDALASSDGIAEDDADRARHYGPQKAACERVVSAAFGDRALIVRPGLITRPLAEPVDAVLDEFATLVDDDPRRRGKLSRERERELIARWREGAKARDAAGPTTP